MPELSTSMRVLGKAKPLLALIAAMLLLPLPALAGKEADCSDMADFAQQVAEWRDAGVSLDIVKAGVASAKGPQIPQHLKDSADGLITRIYNDPKFTLLTRPQIRDYVFHECMNEDKHD